jgi:hypothetical protein
MFYSYSCSCSNQYTTFSPSVINHFNTIQYILSQQGEIWSWKKTHMDKGLPTQLERDDSNLNISSSC